MQKKMENGLLINGAEEKILKLLKSHNNASFAVIIDAKVKKHKKKRLTPSRK